MSDVTLERLEDQLQWYEKKSSSNQKAFKYLKISTITAAACIPVLATLSRLSIVTAVLGVVIVVLEGLQQVNQYHANWISYRATCESLKHEKFLFLANAGTYAAANNARALLAERVEALVSQEHAHWVSNREQAEKAYGDGAKH